MGRWDEGGGGGKKENKGKEEGGGGEAEFKGEFFWEGDLDFIFFRK